MAAGGPVPFQLQPIALFAIHRALLLAGRVLTFSTHTFQHSPYLDAFKLHELARIVLPNGVPSSLYAVKLLIIAAIATVAVVTQLQHRAKNGRTKKQPNKDKAAPENWIKEQVAMPMVMALMVSSALQVTALMLFGHDTCAAPPHNIMDFVLLMVACCFALMAAIRMDGGHAKHIKSLHLSTIVAAAIAISWFGAYLLAFVTMYAAERGVLASAYLGLKDKVASPSAGVLTYLLALTPKSLMMGLVKQHVLVPCLVAAAAATLCVFLYLGSVDVNNKEQSQQGAEKRALRKRVHTLMLGLLLSLTLLAAVISYAYSFDRR